MVVDGYHLPAIYNQINPPKSEAPHVTPVRMVTINKSLAFHFQMISVSKKNRIVDQLLLPLVVVNNKNVAVLEKLDLTKRMWL